MNVDTRTFEEQLADDLEECRGFGNTISAQESSMGWFVELATPAKRLATCGPFEDEETALYVGVQRILGDDRPVDDIIEGATL